SYSDASQRLLNEVANARVTLLDPSRRTPYDQQLLRALGSSQKPHVVESNRSSLASTSPSFTPHPTSTATAAPAVHSPSDPIPASSSVRRPSRHQSGVKVASALHFAWIVIGGVFG